MSSNPRRSNGTRRNRLRRRVLREESTCHLCDQPVDTRLPHGLPASPEVDELLPVTHGGDPYNRANCRLAHRYCNRLRWHGTIQAARAKLAANRPRFGADGHLIEVNLEPIVSRQW